MALALVELLKKTGRALLSIKLTIMLNSLTLLNNESFQQGRVWVTASDAGNTMDQDLEVLNYMHRINHLMVKEHVIHVPIKAVALTISELTQREETR